MQVKLFSIEVKLTKYVAVMKHKSFEFFGTREQAEQAAKGLAEGIKQVYGSMEKEGQRMQVWIDGVLFMDSTE